MRTRSDSPRPSNLPVLRRPLIGREREVAQVVALLERDEVGLVTLLGPGGSGKTRLALEVAATLHRLEAARFEDGVHFVDLAPLREPDLVIPTIADSLGVPEAPGRPRLSTLADYLRPRRLLLVLDNFEQVRAAAVHLADLLGSCQNLKLLVTSRIALRVRDEHEFWVPPLPHPGERAAPGLASDGGSVVGLEAPGHLADRVLEYTAVQLFAQRARTVRSDFQVDDANAAIVGEVCRRLDGIPLAIELAAARVKLFSPEALLARLGRRLPLLAGGPQDLPARQRTMSDAIGWSYDLLGEQEKRLFRHLGVFVGGFTLGAVEAVCREECGVGVDTLDGVALMVDASLIQPAEVALTSASGGRRERDGNSSSEPRFTMLETIQEYALGKLAEQGEIERARDAHARHFLQLAEVAEPHLRSAEQLSWVARLRLDYANIRAALDWGVLHPESELGLRLAAALAHYWRLRGETTSEGSLWLRRTLETSARRRGLPFARALQALSVVSRTVGSHSQALAEVRESAAIFAAEGEGRGLAVALVMQGLDLCQLDDDVGAHRLYDDALTLARSLGDEWVLARVLQARGMSDLKRGELAAARAAEQESCALFRAVGDRWGLMTALTYLSFAVGLQGDHAEATTLAEEVVALARELDNPSEVARGIEDLGYLAEIRGDWARAREHYGESKAMYRSLGLDFEAASVDLSEALVALLGGDHVAVIDNLRRALAVFKPTDHRLAAALCLLGVAGSAEARGQFERASCLFTVANRYLTEPDLALQPAARAIFGRLRGSARSKADWRSLAGRGIEPESITLEEAITYALSSAGEQGEGESEEEVPTPRQRAKREHWGLTEREREVARLIVEGKSNREIAEELVVGTKTVEAHVTRILTKLGFSSRAQIAAWAVDKGHVRAPQPFR